MRQLYSLVFILIVFAGCTNSSIPIASTTEQNLSPDSYSIDNSINGAEPIRSIVGEYDVKFSVVTRETESEKATNGGGMRAVRIDFFENYVLVHCSDRTEMFRVDKLERFSAFKVQ